MIVALAAALALAATPSDPPAAAPTEAAPAAAPAPPPGPDRTKPPAVAAPTLRTLAEPTVHTVGAARVHHIQVPDVRKVSVILSLGRGAVDLDGQPREWTRALGALWAEATKTHPADELALLLDLNDVDLSTQVGPHAGFVELQVPKEKVDVAFSLGRELLTEPTLHKKDVARWIRDRKVWLELNGPSSQSAVADSALTFAWYPADHPYGARPDPLAAAEVTSKQLKAGFASWLSDVPVDVLIVGDLPWSAVEAAVTAMVDGLGASGERSPDLHLTPTPGTRVYAIDMPGQAQVAVRMQTTAPWRPDGDYPASQALNWALGGNFLSRLNSNLREEKGYTYGARSRYFADDTRGSFSVGVDVPSGVLASTVTEIDRELQRTVDAGVTADELDAAWRAMAKDWNETYADAGTATGAYFDGFEHRESMAERQARLQSLDATTPLDVQRVAATVFGAETPRVWVFVGDKAAIEAQLAGFGWTLTWVSPEAALLGTF